MKAKALILPIVAISITAMWNCKKPDNSPISGGGKGGKAVVTVTPEHHGEFVDTCMIYIKYGTNDAPADNIYDDSSACILKDTTPVATFSNLKTGLYYLYGKGYHATYSPPNVKGGLPCTIKQEDTTNVFLPTYSY